MITLAMATNQPVHQMFLLHSVDCTLPLDSGILLRLDQSWGGGGHYVRKQTRISELLYLMYYNVA